LSDLVVDGDDGNQSGPLITLKKKSVVLKGRQARTGRCLQRMEARRKLRKRSRKKQSVGSRCRNRGRPSPFDEWAKGDGAGKGGELAKEKRMWA